MAQVLCQLPKFTDEKLIVGFDTSDDALVYKVREDLAVVQTVDFFPPIVDDPYTFGQIAAANSLSDIYAMGGDPSIAMNLICFPTCLPMDIMAKILQGGANKVAEAGAIIAGGHTIEDSEPKYGLCVTGFIHPDKVMQNSQCQVGDVLVLTKPLGIGVLTTAMKAQITDEISNQAVITAMTTLNKYGKDAMVEIGANACTDVTGFGLIGHASEMAKGSNVTIELDSKAIPLLPGAEEFAKMGIIPAGAYSNMSFVKDDYIAEPTVAQHTLDLLMDPQTSGGLLISLPPEKAKLLVEKLEGVTLCNAIIGRVMPQQEKAILVK